MTRNQYIDAVKVKLEEISPFDEPDSFIADGDEAATTVKPFISYIDRSLDEAAHHMLRTLPLTLLHADIERSTPTMSVDTNGVGFIVISPQRRFVRLRHPALRRDITAFISSEDPLYLLQQKKCTRGGTAKPVAVVASNVVTGLTGNTGQMEIYSFPESMYNTDDNQSLLLSINTEKHLEDRSTTDPAFTDTNFIKSPIEEFIVLECAAMVAEILSDTNTAQICRQELQSKIQATLQ